MKKVIIIGNGSAGLLLALTLRKKNFDVTIISRLKSSDENSAIILPQITQNFLESVCPGIVSELKNSDALKHTHHHLIKIKFKELSITDISSDSFILLSRNLFIDTLFLRAKFSGVRIIQDDSLKFVVRDNVITQIQGDIGEYEADYVFDCTGNSDSRKNWLGSLIKDEKIYYKGNREEVFQRFFHCPFPPDLLIQSSDGCRGGIYPVEGSRFVLTLSCTSGDFSLDSINAKALSFSSQLNGNKYLDAASPEGDWKKVEKRAFYSNFYEISPRMIQNFYPFGESLLSSQPIYGRGVSLVVLQLEPIVERISSDSTEEEIFDALSLGFQNAEEKWKEIAQDIPFISRFLRKWANRLIEKDPYSYEQMLRFYQLKCSPGELFIKFLAASFRLKFGRRSSTDP